MNKKYLLLIFVAGLTVACQQKNPVHDPLLDARLCSVKESDCVLFSEIRIYISKTDGDTHQTYKLQDMLGNKPFRVFTENSQIKDLLEVTSLGIKEGRQNKLHPAIDWQKSKYIAHIYYITKNYESYGYAIIFFYKINSTGKVVSLFFPQNADAIYVNTKIANHLGDLSFLFNE